ncbi:MAG: cell envelope integrity protein CreD [Bacteroidales bacterium]|nr:cell envelope integrity protein CreD [Bacteroidales bacterium]
MTTIKNEKNGKWSQSITLKLILVITLSLVLLIPSSMIRGLIEEREQRKNETITEITGKWGAEQTICGPVLILPYTVLTKQANGLTTETKEYYQVMPDKIKLSGNIDTEKRYRSIYEVLTFAGNFNITGNFSKLTDKEWPENHHSILWNEAKLVIGISDLKGITRTINMNWNGSNKKFAPGNAKCTLFKTGVNTTINITPDGEYQFSVSFSLNGSNAIFINPVANESEISLSADWNNPSFDGNFLPADKTITDSGFIANWATNDMNRNYPQIISTGSYSAHFDYQKVGVKLLLPVDAYQKSTRSVKYALLFIGLTFLIMFFAEIIGKTRIHPVQYLIVGIALVVFYSLLLALAEYTGFNQAFIIAATVIIAMITAFIHSLFKTSVITLIIALVLFLLYTYLFTVVQIADYALIIGNVGLVIILGLVMVFSKKIDWYANNQNMDTPSTNNIQNE